MTVLPDSMMLQVQTYAEILKGGGVVAFPTETVYGLGAGAWNPAAISKVYELKGRPADNPLIVHVSNYSMLLQFAVEIPEDARLLMQKLWPGPLTLVFEKKAQVLDVISAGLSSVAVRMPDHDIALKLIDKAGPLVAPSANKSGRPSPTRASHVREDFGMELPVLDGGECMVGLESTVIDVRTKPFRILRPGFISADLIKNRTGIEVIDADNDASALPGDEEKVDRSILLAEGVELPEVNKIPVSPGIKYTHYAPNTPVRWLIENELSKESFNSEILYLVQSYPTGLPTGARNIVNFDGNMEAMAQQLYDWFRKSDVTGYSEIVIEPIDNVKNKELAKALKNRISKAIAR